MEENEELNEEKTNEQDFRIARYNTDSLRKYGHGTRIGFLALRLM